MGTSKEYGNGPIPFKVDQRERAVSPYSASKTAANHFAQMTHFYSVLPVVIARTFVTCGPRQKPDKFIPSLIEHCFWGCDFEMTSGEQTCDYVYASDIVEVLIKAASTPAAVEVINLGRGRECQIRKLADERVKPTRSRIKIKVGAMAKRVGETKHFCCSAQMAVKILDWNANISLDEGLKKP